MILLQTCHFPNLYSTTYPLSPHLVSAFCTKQICVLFILHSTSHFLLKNHNLRKSGVFVLQRMQLKLYTISGLTSTIAPAASVSNGEISRRSLLKKRNHKNKIPSAVRRNAEEKTERKWMKMEGWIQKELLVRGVVDGFGQVLFDVGSVQFHLWAWRLERRHDLEKESFCRDFAFAPSYSFRTMVMYDSVACRPCTRRDRGVLVAVQTPSIISKQVMRYK